jgi:hypothetical protein
VFVVVSVYFVIDSVRKLLDILSYSLYLEAVSSICNPRMLYAVEIWIPINVFVVDVRGCIKKFADWAPGARTANGTALCL